MCVYYSRKGNTIVYHMYTYIYIYIYTIYDDIL